AINKVETIALGHLSTNPFADASAAFFNSLQQAATVAFDQPVNIIRPFCDLHKDQVLSFAAGLPLELTFSCIEPLDNMHCGRCNKCAERQHAFQQARIKDK